MTSVVIAAHDEERSIGPTLAGLLSGGTEDLEIVVVCNGCRDRTADVARSFGDAVQVIELEQPSKTAALNAGDRCVTTFPRIYLDADVRLTATDVAALAAALERAGVLAASARPWLDVRGAPWAVRAYYRVWERLPQVRTGIVGAGVYAVSAEGRARWQEFPDVIADDLFVQRQFTPAERVAVEAATTAVAVPRTLSALVRRKVRVFAGNRLVHDHLGATERPPIGWLRVVRDSPRLVADAAVYLGVNAVAKARARAAVAAGGAIAWSADQTTRVGGR